MLFLGQYYIAVIQCWQESSRPYKMYHHQQLGKKKKKSYFSMKCHFKEVKVSPDESRSGLLLRFAVPISTFPHSNQLGCFCALGSIL